MTFQTVDPLFPIEVRSYPKSKSTAGHVVLDDGVAISDAADHLKPIIYLVHLGFHLCYMSDCYSDMIFLDRRSVAF